MSDSFENKTIPGFLLLGLALLIAISLTAVIAVDMIGYEEPAPQINGSLLDSRDLLFEDIDAGGVAVYDRRDGRLIDTLPAGSDNFIRGVLRGLARERRGIGAGAEIPFRVSRFADGSVTLQDLATGRTLVLQAFGLTNARAFARLLDEDPSLAQLR